MQDIKDSINMVKEFMELWVKFNQTYKKALQNPSVTEEEEEVFLETKSDLARRFQTLADTLSIDTVTLDRTYNVVNQIITLKSMATISEHGLRNLDNNWHESYISLNRLLGHLEAQRDKPPEGGGVVARTSKSIAHIIMYTLFILVLICIILFLIYILIPVK